MHVCLKALRIFTQILGIKVRKMVDQSNNFKELKYLDVGGSKTISEILAQVSQIDDFSKKTSNLDFYVGALEEELIKIDAFRRELPICMQLLKDAIERLKEEKLQWRGREMEEFIVLKSSNLDGDGRAKVLSNDFNEKKSWMSCVQLWSTPVHYENNFNNQERKEEGDSSNGCGGESDEYEGCNLKKRRSSSGSFVPFEKGTASVPSLTLSTPSVVDYFNGRPGKVVQQPQEQQRKQRRCWSPELHKRFVDALHQLGGPKTATPKQIRELMKVEGLTNDEVKSHLQKFRIHIRKLPSSSSAR